MNDPDRQSGSDNSQSGSDARSAFRGNIPPTPNAPDRAEWVRQGHPEPIELKEVPARFVTQALNHIERDFSTLSFQEAVRWQVRLEELCMAMTTFAPEPMTLRDLIFFDTETKSFWLYRSASPAPTV
jgi:hypothetical protein